MPQGASGERTVRFRPRCRRLEPVADERSRGRTSPDAAAARRRLLRCSTSPATTTSGCAGTRPCWPRGAEALRVWGAGSTGSAGWSPARRPCTPSSRHALAAARRHRGRAGVLVRLHRQPRRGHRPGGPGHAAGLRRAQPRLADRRLPALAGRDRRGAAPFRTGGRGGAALPPAGTAGDRADRLGVLRRRRPGRAGRIWPPSAAATTRCCSSTTPTGSVCSARPGPGAVARGRPRRSAGRRHHRDACRRRSAARAAWCSASQSVVDHLVDAARSFIFDTGLAPVSVGTALAALRSCRHEPDRPARTRAVAARLASGLGVPVPSAAVVPGGARRPRSGPSRRPRPARATAFWSAASAHRRCRQGTSRLRLAARADLTDDEIALAVKVVSAAISG